jgi:hypothetical protein
VLGVVLGGRGAASGVTVEAELDLPNVFARGARWVFLSSTRSQNTILLLANERVIYCL